MKRLPFFPARRHCASRRDGYALVMTLAFLVLLTALAVAFFSRVTTERLVSNSAANKTRTDILARSALDVIVGDLRQEIVNGSTLSGTGSDSAIYVPRTNTDMLPKKSGVPATPTGGLPPIPNLIRRSVRSDPLAASSPKTVSVAASAVNSTTDLSQNGRFVNLARWNSHYLIPRLSTGTTIDSTPVSTFTAPDWVMVTKTGAKVLTAPDSNTIGRYSYAIYNEGGLLDANVVGYPGGMPAAQYSLKGSQAFADLTQMPLASDNSTLSQSDINQIVGWRNHASAQATGTLGSYAFSAAGLDSYVKSVQAMQGLQSVNPSITSGRTDQLFTSRQSLLSFRRSAGFSQNALQFLGTFSADLNAPTWEPRTNASTWGGTDAGIDTVTGAAIANTYAYKTRADDPAAPNRRLYNVRVGESFTRLDGSTAVPGEPLIQTRFDLSRLSWIRNDGELPAGVTSDDIYNYFGLRRQSGGAWLYDHGQTSRIMTLEEVAQARRDPDFFELLQAGILQGSLGMNSGNPATASASGTGGEFYRATHLDWRGGGIVRTDMDSAVVYAQEKYQIMQIGANMIDQADEDSYPTEVILNGEHFSGIENLPYLNAMGDTALRAAPGATITPNNYQAYVHRWITFSLWNPHQNATVTANAPADAPLQFRVYCDQGQGNPGLQNTPRTAAKAIPPWLQGFDFEQKPGWIAFNLNDYPGKFAEPTILDYEHTAAAQVSEANGRVQAGSQWKRAGIYAGYSYSPDYVQKVAACAPVASDAPTSLLYNSAQIRFTTPLVVKLQYMDPAGTWRTYQLLRGVYYSRDGRGDPYMEPNDPAWATNTSASTSNGPLTLDQEAWILSFLDPRCMRLNMCPRKNMRLAENATTNDVDSFPPQGPHFPLTPTAWKNWVNNAATNVSYYTDRDYVRRVGDAAGWANADPLPAGRGAQRPRILNRPFRSVAELGYVFRDDPWKTLNFVSTSAPPAAAGARPNGADAALLDIFCVGPVPSTAAATPRVAWGRLNINAAPVPVLQALLANTLRDYSLTDATQVSTTISAADSQAIATDIARKVLTSGPIINMSELPDLFPQDTSVSTKYPGQKGQREAMLRGLMNTCSTRTWNLMIDIVAQTGKYGPRSTSVGDFIVEGETRYWLHVAIDRYTGQVISQQLELVSE